MPPHCRSLRSLLVVALALPLATPAPAQEAEPQNACDVLSPGDLVVTDIGGFNFGDGALYLVKPDGTVECLAGCPGGPPTFLSFPQGVAVDRHGRIYVSELGTGLLGPWLLSFDPTSGEQEILSFGGLFESISQLALDARGRIFVASYGTDPNITQVDPVTGFQIPVFRTPLVSQDLCEVPVDGGTQLTAEPTCRLLVPDKNDPDRLATPCENQDGTCVQRVLRPEGLAVAGDGDFLLPDRTAPEPDVEIFFSDGSVQATGLYRLVPGRAAGLRSAPGIDPLFEPGLGRARAVSTDPAFQWTRGIAFDPADATVALADRDAQALFGVTVAPESPDAATLSGGGLFVRPSAVARAPRTCRDPADLGSEILAEVACAGDPDCPSHFCDGVTQTCRDAATGAGVPGPLGPFACAEDADCASVCDGIGGSCLDPAGTDPLLRATACQEDAECGSDVCPAVFLVGDPDAGRVIRVIHADQAHALQELATTGSGGLTRPWAVAVVEECDPLLPGTFFVADPNAASGAPSVLRVDLTAGTAEGIDTGAPLDARDVALEPGGDLIVLDGPDRIVRVSDPLGSPAFATIPTPGPLRDLTAITVDGAGDLYATDAGDPEQGDDPTIWRIDATGAVPPENLFPDGSDLRDPIDLGVTGLGYLVVLDAGSLENPPGCLEGIDDPCEPPVAPSLFRLTPSTGALDAIAVAQAASFPEGRSLAVDENDDVVLSGAGFQRLLVEGPAAFVVQPAGNAGTLLTSQVFLPPDDESGELPADFGGVALDTNRDRIAVDATDREALRLLRIDAVTSIVTPLDVAGLELAPVGGAEPPALPRLLPRITAATPPPAPFDDADADGIPAVVDNCPGTPNGPGGGTCTAGENEGLACSADEDCGEDGTCSLAQEDADDNGVGDACNDGMDRDGDEFEDDLDPCPDLFDPPLTAFGDGLDKARLDADGDGLGNACDSDDDGDGIEDGADNCPLLSNVLQADEDGDGIGDGCDNCATIPNGVPDIAQDRGSCVLDTPAGAPCSTGADCDSGVCSLADEGLCTSGPNFGGTCSTQADCLADGQQGTCALRQDDLDLDGAGDACDGDLDGDAIGNTTDNCPFVTQADQLNTDAAFPGGDDLGDACDDDDDADGVPDDGDGSDDPDDNPCANGQTADCDDSCRVTPNGPDLGTCLGGPMDGMQCSDDGACGEEGTCSLGQEDADGDAVGDVCDNCAATPNGPAGGTCSSGPLEGMACADDDGCDGGTCSLDQEDGDGDGVGFVCDNCPSVANGDQADGDLDALGDVCDNCPEDSNPDQADFDGDGLGDVCEDSDGDGAADAVDNCPTDPNPDQLDGDTDAVGDVCDNCAATPNGPAGGTCRGGPLDGMGCGADEACGAGGLCSLDQEDADADGYGDTCDNCPSMVNSDQRDTNGDGYGNRCDFDYNGDGVVQIGDFNILADAFGYQEGDAAYDPDVDCNGDGVVQIGDFDGLASSFGLPVGGTSVCIELPAP